MQKQRRLLVFLLVAVMTVIGLPVAYLLALGPFIWTGRHGMQPSWLTTDYTNTFLVPFNWAYNNLPFPISNALRSYVDFWGSL